MDCIFCKIIAGEIPSKKVYSDELCYAFCDIAPQAPVHILIVPRQHIVSAAEISPENSALVGHIFEVIAKIAAEQGLSNGFRVVSNCGEDACQSVKHLHFHILGGTKMSDKMA
jgi:histidine triad (HIT) family protein